MSNPYFELWDLVSGNLAAEYASEEDALRFLFTVLTEEGEESVAGYGLDQIPNLDDSETAIFGEDLVKRVIDFSRNEALTAR